MERKIVNRTARDRADYLALPRHSLVLCAALVQNPANLGGLCRTAEAFRLEALILPNLDIVQNVVFKRSSVSSHGWQPLQACSVEALPDWLQQQQSGYCRIALDCDPTATPLSEFAFPKRSILLLGQELTGVPMSCLDQCDRVITIPQFGLVESLNVQTAAAIAVYEYVRQQSSSAPADRLLNG